MILELTDPQTHYKVLVNFGPGMVITPVKLKAGINAAVVLPNGHAVQVAETYETIRAMINSRLDVQNILHKDGQIWSSTMSNPIIEQSPDFRESP